MAGARDVLRATRRIREEQRKRNAAAIAEAQERQTKLEEEAERIRPSARRRLAAREEGVHRIKQAASPANKMQAPGENKGEVVLQFETEGARALAERYLAEHEIGSEKYQGFVDLLAEATPSAATGFTEDDVDAAIEAVETAETTDSVAFASRAAGELAAEAGLSASAFEGREASGAGGYTTADVRAIIEGEVGDG